jgi:hypothetical protein
VGAAERRPHVDWRAPLESQQHRRFRPTRITTSCGTRVIPPPVISSNDWLDCACCPGVASCSLPHSLKRGLVLDSTAPIAARTRPLQPQLTQLRDALTFGDAHHLSLL